MLQDSAPADLGLERSQRLGAPATAEPGQPSQGGGGRSGAVLLEDMLAELIQLLLDGVQHLGEGEGCG